MAIEKMTIHSTDWNEFLQKAMDAQRDGWRRDPAYPVMDCAMLVAGMLRGEQDAPAAEPEVQEVKDEDGKPEVSQPVRPGRPKSK